MTHAAPSSLASSVTQLLLPDQLEAHALSHAEWHDAFVGAFAFSLMTSFIIVDGIKVGVLTFMSLPWVEAALQGDIRSRVIRKPLRRLHKVLDVML